MWSGDCYLLRARNLGYLERAGYVLFQPRLGVGAKSVARALSEAETPTLGWIAGPSSLNFEILRIPFLWWPQEDLRHCEALSRSVWVCGFILYEASHLHHGFALPSWGRDSKFFNSESPSVLWEQLGRDFLSWPSQTHFKKSERWSLCKVYKCWNTMLYTPETNNTICNYNFLKSP